MHKTDFIIKHKNEFLQALENVLLQANGTNVAISEWLDQVHKLLGNVKKSGKKIFLIGNGASSAMSSHYAADLTKNAGINSYSLTDGALLTCFSNDFSYQTAFSEMLKRYMNEGDVLFGISSSGKSENIVNAAEYVKVNIPEAKIITCTGFKKNNPLMLIGDLNLYIDNSDYGIVESAHAYYIHLIIDLFINIEENIGENNVG